MACRSCDREIDEGADFCPYCGVFQTAAAPGAPTPAETPTAVAPAPRAPATGAMPSPAPVPTYARTPSGSDSSLGPSVGSSLLSRAKAGDEDALRTMFRQFLDEDERVVETAYLGVMGMFFGNHSLGCITDRRVATIRTGSFGEMTYQDGYLEEINSTVVYQPAIWKLYVAFVLYGLFALSIAGGVFAFHFLAGLLFLLLLCLPMVLLPRIYYRFVKSGLVAVVGEGASVYMFADRQRLRRANGLLRRLSVYRERRVQLRRRR